MDLMLSGIKFLKEDEILGQCPLSAKRLAVSSSAIRASHPMLLIDMSHAHATKTMSSNAKVSKLISKGSESRMLREEIKVSYSTSVDSSQVGESEAKFDVPEGEKIRLGYLIERKGGSRLRSDSIESFSSKKVSD